MPQNSQLGPLLGTLPTADNHVLTLDSIDQLCLTSHL